MDLPDRFHVNDSDEDAAEPSGAHPETYVQQSVFGILAGVQQKNRLVPKLSHNSESDSDSDEADVADVPGQDTTHKGSALQTTQRPPPGMEDRRTDFPLSESTHHRKSKTMMESKLVKSVLKPMRRRSSLQDDDYMTQSQLLPPKGNVTLLRTSDEGHRRPGTEADAKLSDFEAQNALGLLDEPEKPKHLHGSISQVLADIFRFPSPEVVVSEHPCWYLQSVLLQGYMYITQKHICFYAYLPKKSHLAKSGTLSKQGKHRSAYRRYWFTLKGDVLSYFVSAAEPFFPAGSIDLRYATSAEMAPQSGVSANSEFAVFTITTSNRTHYFMADTASVAAEWVRQLQKVIFRSQNDDDSVKISIPLENVVDIERNPILDMAQTVKIRVLDSEETYAVDEYFFTFFSGGDVALSTLISLTEKVGTQLRSTLSGETRTEKAGTHRSRKLSFSRHADASPSSLRQTEESADSTETTSDSAAALSFCSDNEADGMSASQMLLGDSAFRTPTLRKSEIRAPAHCAPTAPKHSSTGPPTGVDQSKTSDSVTGTPSPRTIATSLQQAYTLAEVVRNQSKRMSSYLSSSPKNYYEKFSGAIAGGKRHYSEMRGLNIEDGVDDPELELETAEHERRFQQHFALPVTERLRAVYYCSLHRVLPLYGKIYISDSRFCFRSLLYGTRTKLVVPFKEIDNVTKEKGFRWGYPGMVLIIRRHEELFFDFGSFDARDDCVVTLLRALDVMKVSAESMILTKEEQYRAGAAAAENEVLEDARRSYKDLEPDAGTDNHLSSRDDFRVSSIDDAMRAAAEHGPKKSLRITCLTVGSRGDVQPYIALCKGLMRDGHQVKIATHAQFEAWIRSHGIGFEPVAGDPAELMRMCVENGMFTPSFVIEATSKFSDWLEGLLETSWRACANSDLLIESPCAMGGLHIAEALAIPYFRAFTMPWTKTRAYPHAFAKHGKRLGGQYNYTSYTIFDFFFWMMMSSHINRWRKKRLGLQPTDATKMQTNKVPFLYNFSPSVVPPPLDFSDWIKITGYWFLDEGDDWQPPADLMNFIQRAREDNMKLIYIGFGSVPVSDSKALTQQIVDGVLMADVRCILSKGWSDHFTKDDPTVPEVELPPAIFQIRAAPHDWLFKQIDAVLHHGGAGTTGASLRAGVPTIIRPFFGDQHFFASRVEDLGVGIQLEKFTTTALGKAIWCATHDERMRTKARLLGEKIRAENGVQTAINAIYRDLDYARSLIKTRGVTAPTAAEEDDEREESWTFVENDGDLDVENTRTGNVATSWMPHQQSARNIELSS